jgi:transcriptional regulator with XRE-family HTH domain
MLQLQEKFFILYHIEMKKKTIKGSSEVGSFGSRLKKERKRLNLRQVDLAEKIGISERAVSAFEIGEYGPSVDTLRELAFGGIDILYLITGVKLPPEQLRTIREKLGVETDRDEIVSEIHYLVDELV